MDYGYFIKKLTDQVGEPPVWTPTRDDAEQFNQWKAWSAKKTMLNVFQAQLRVDAEKKK